MKKLFPFLIIMFLSCLFAEPDGLRPASYAVPCMTAILNCRYDAAFAIIDSAAQVDKKDPLAPLLRLTALGIRIVDFDSTIDTAYFFRTHQLTQTTIEQFERDRGVSGYSKMLSGICKGIYSAFYLRRGSYYIALQNGFETLDLLNEAVRLDSSLIDPLFLLGLYDYARGEMKKRLWWIMFWYPGSKDRGITRLWTCRKQGVLTGTAALFTLSEIYLRENNTEESMNIMNLLEKDFSKSRFFLWQKTKYLESKRLFYEASLACELLADSYAHEPYGNYNVIFSQNQRAHLLVKSGQKKEALEVCRQILNTAPTKRNKVILKDTEKLLRSLDGR
jgi:tetratricopeptide (TPR) repeat protein